MPQRDPGVYLEDIESREIIGFRNILVHGYAELDHRKVYDVAVRHAPALLSVVKDALRAFPEPPGPAGHEKD